MVSPEDWQMENSPACRAAEADARLPEQVNTRLALRRGSGEFMRRWCKFALLVAVGVFAAGCPKDKQDRKSTRLNSSHTVISYAVFCLKKKKRTHNHYIA